jgi:hypothetical protein
MILLDNVSTEKDWVSWGLAWRAHYDTTAPKPQTVDPTGKPSLPLPGATDEEWLAYGLEMTEWSKKQNAGECQYPFCWPM